MRIKVEVEGFSFKEQKETEELNLDNSSFSGVYKLINLEGKIVYVGISEDISRRVNVHRQENRIEFSRYEYINCSSEDAKVVEVALIKHYQPEFNKQHKGKI